MFKPLQSVRINLLLLSLLAAPAWAQFEISPDHFENQDSGSVSTDQTQSQTQIAQLQARIQDYETQLKSISEQAEASRQESISAGILGDGAGSYIDACRRQQKELEVVEQSLNLQINQARRTIAALQAQPTMVAVKTMPGHAAERPRQARQRRKQRPEQQLAARITGR